MDESKLRGDVSTDRSLDPGRAAIERAAGKTVTALTSQHSMLSGEDSGLGNVWLEFCVQVQGEQSVDWDDFDAVLRQSIESVLVSMTSEERKVIWLRTPAGLGEEADASPIQIPADDDDLIQAVYSYVWQLAADLQDERVERYLRGGEDPLDEDEHSGEDEDRDEDEREGEGDAEGGSESTEDRL